MVVVAANKSRTKKFIAALGLSAIFHGVFSEILQQSECFPFPSTLLALQPQCEG
jgi:hypothetical protein